MKKIRVAVLACVGSVVASTSACTSLLGDFEVGTASDAGAGVDVAPPLDAPTEAAPVDAGPDADNDYAQLSCVEVANTRNKLGTLQPPSSAPVNNNNSTPDQVWTWSYQGSNNTARAVTVVPDTFGSIQTYVYDVDGNGSSNVKNQALAAQGQLLAAKRYDRGIAILVARVVQDPNDAGTPGIYGFALDVFKLPDDGVWSAPVRVVSPPNVGAVINCVQRIAAGFHVRDAANDDYDVVYSYQDAALINPPQNCGAYTTKLKAVHFSGRSGVVQTWPLPPGVTGVELPEDAIVVGVNNAFVMLNPNTGAGAPPPGLAPFMVQADPGTLAHKVAIKVPLKNNQDFLMAAAMHGQAATDSIGVAFLEGNLGNANSKPTFYVGSVQGGNLGGITPSTGLTASELGGLTDLPVDKSSYHWEGFPSPQSPSHNFLAIARAFPNQVGFNFIWWDAKGRIRSQRTGGSPGGPLVKPKGPQLSLGASVTFVRPPSVLLATMQLAWTEDPGITSSDGGKAFDVWAMQMICTK